MNNDTSLNDVIKVRASKYGENALDVMVDIMNDNEVPPQVRLAAADKVLDRGVGRPRQEIELETSLYVDAELTAKINTDFMEKMVLARARMDKVLADRK